MRPTRIARTAATLLAAAPLAGACNELLKANAPQLIEESSLQLPANAPVIAAGAIGDFECAFANYIAVMGTVSDEFADSQANAATWDLDRRTNFPNTALYATGGCGGFGGVYTPVSTARYQADNALKLLDAWTDQEVEGRQALIARMAAYAGYSLILLGEGFCSASIDLGPELTPAQVFALAEQRFTRAIQAAQTAGGAAGDSIRYLALVGRARARIDQNKRTEAAADAALVPNGFTFLARYTAAAGRAENRVFRTNNSNGTVTVDPSFRNVTVGTAADARVPVTDAGRGGSFPQVRLWVQGKYASLTAPIPIATWREALLIRAEAAANAGDATAAVGFINQLRQAANVPAFSATTAAAVTAQLPEERRRELFLESHRLFDTIRFNVPLSPAPGAAFPVGGGTYGDNKCLPLPDVERLNNPTLQGRG
jgi:starch-binding outer membrane protein, SusD/RagB family